jgi:hypothetical protein
MADCDGNPQPAIVQCDLFNGGTCRRPNTSNTVLDDPRPNHNDHHIPEEDANVIYDLLLELSLVGQSISVDALPQASLMCSRIYEMVVGCGS